MFYGLNMRYMRDLGRKKKKRKFFTDLCDANELQYDRRLSVGAVLRDHFRRDPIGYLCSHKTSEADEMLEREIRTDERGVRY